MKWFRSTGLVLAAAVATAPVLRGADWPQWRGPNAQGVSAETGLPTAWTAREHVLWKLRLPGAGLSSPIVSRGHVFVTVAIEGEPVANPGAATRQTPDPQSVGLDRRQTLQLVAVDADTGAIRWTRTAHDGPVYDARFKRSSFAAPTPVTDGTLVYAYFGPEGLFAYDFEGRQVWKVVERFRVKGVGAGSSPIIAGDLVIVLRDEEDGAESAIVAYDKRTGREAWRTRRAVQLSWTTPVLVEAGGRTELIAAGWERIVAYDPATGRELWSVDGLRSGAMHTPLVAGGLVIVTAGCPSKRVLALRPGPGIGADRRVAWEYAKGTGCPLSNIAYRGAIFLFTENGIATVLDPRDGAVRAQGIRPPAPAQFTASPVAYGGFIALTSEEGETFMLQAEGTPVFVGRNPIGESVRASAAVANGRIYLRGDTHLVAIGGSL